MRVLLTSQHFLPEYIGGSERYVQSLAFELEKLGDQVSIIARAPAGRPPVPRTVRERLPDGARLYRLHGGEFDLERFLHHQQELDREFTAALLEQRPDVVHVNHLRSLSPRFVEVALQLGAAVVISLHDFYFACPLAHLQKTDGSLCGGPDGGHECARTCFSEDSNATPRWTARADYFQRILSLAQRVVCYSKFVASWFEAFGLDRSRVRVLPIGITTPPSVAASPMRRSHTLHLACCGSVIRYKGAHVILDALRIADLGAVKLSLLGSTPDADYVGELKQKAAQIPAVTLNFHGSYHWDELTSLLEGIDCVVSPTLVAETFGMVSREALVRGIPIAVSKLGALPEIVREGENGFVFDPRQPAKLAEIFVRLARDQALTARLRLGARSTRIENAAGHAASMQSIYREAIDSAGRGASALPNQLLELSRINASLLELGF